MICQGFIAFEELVACNAVKVILYEGSPLRAARSNISRSDPFGFLILQCPPHALSGFFLSPTRHWQDVEPEETCRVLTCGILKVLQPVTLCSGVFPLCSRANIGNKVFLCVSKLLLYAK